MSLTLGVKVLKQFLGRGDPKSMTDALHKQKHCQNHKVAPNEKRKDSVPLSDSSFTVQFNNS